MTTRYQEERNLRFFVSRACNIAPDIIFVTKSRKSGSLETYIHTILSHSSMRSRSSSQCVSSNENFSLSLRTSVYNTYNVSITDSIWKHNDADVTLLSLIFAFIRNFVENRIGVYERSKLPLILSRNISEDQLFIITLLTLRALTLILLPYLRRYNTQTCFQKKKKKSRRICAY